MKCLFLLTVFFSLTACSQKNKNVEEKLSPAHQEINANSSEPSQNGPSKNCIFWHDGCNDCKVKNGKILSCTKKMCFTMGKPKCVKTK